MTAHAPLHVAPSRGVDDPMLVALSEAMDALARCRAAPAVALYERSVELNLAAQRLGLALLDALCLRGVVVLEAGGHASQSAPGDPLTEAAPPTEAALPIMAAPPAEAAPPTENAPPVVVVTPVVAVPPVVAAAPCSSLAPTVEVAAPRTPPAPPSPPASAADLLRLKAAGVGGARWVGSEVAPVAVTPPVVSLARPVPVTAATAAVALAEVRRFVDQLDRWRGAPSASQYAMLAWATCRLRHMQDEVEDLPAELRPRIAALFPPLTRFSEVERPGYVHGLGLGHRPPRGTWHDAALAAWREMPCAVGAPADLLEAVDRALEAFSTCQDERVAAEALRLALTAAWTAGDPGLRERLPARLIGFGDRLKGAGVLKTLRAQVRALEDKVAAAEATEDATDPVPEDWPWLSRTQGARVLVFGGDRQAPVRRVKEAFGLGSVDHVSCVNIRKVQSGAERVAGHDLVLLQIRFLSHKASDLIVEACARAGTPFVALQNGMGVAQVRAALERTFGG